MSVRAGHPTAGSGADVGRGLSDRRTVLALLLAPSAAGAAATAVGEAAQPTEPTEAQAGSADYRMTDHVRSYYEAARF